MSFKSYVHLDWKEYDLYISIRHALEGCMLVRSRRSRVRFSTGGERICFGSRRICACCMTTVKQTVHASLLIARVDRVTDHHAYSQVTVFTRGIVWLYSQD